MKDKEEIDDVNDTEEADAAVPERERRGCCSEPQEGVGVGGSPAVGGGRG